MPSLHDVDLLGTSVTEQAAAKFKAAKLGAVVYVGPWSGQSANYRNN